MKSKDIFMQLQNGSDVRGSAIETDAEERNLTPEIVRVISAAFLVWLSERTGKNPSDLKIGVGHDSRLTADELLEGVLKGTGCAEAFDCGLVSTPAMFLSTVLPDTDFDGSVMITASHLPFNRNGLKFFTKDGGLEKSEITEVLKKAVSLSEDGEDERKTASNIKKFDLVSSYSRHLMEIIKNEVKAEDFDHPLAGLHIVEDAGNGAAGFFASEILEPLGADTSGSVFLDPDGHFPNHIPNPENPEAMAAVTDAVLKSGADLGVIFDCDGDRGAVVFSDGTEVNRNALIALMAAIVKEGHPGSTVVTDSVTSDELTEFLEGELGLVHLRYKRGYKNVIDKGIELNKDGTDCELAIETSGHGALKENYFSDDGAYMCVKIICKMAKMKQEGRKIEDLISSLKMPAESKEVRYRISGEDFKEYAAGVLKDFENFASQDERFHVVEPNFEGVRVSFDDDEVKGWLLLRMSLHDPVMPMNAEAEKEGGVGIILGRIQPFISRYEKLS
ncbi:MAG TPA: phosphomannomutase/phosphoglucomutase [Lachnospiraceae bacterium]|nr:phosphomannomutase/phosphoglucomutase [Lachnospiraceae bacterium]